MDITYFLQNKNNELWKACSIGDLNCVKDILIKNPVGLDVNILHADATPLMAAAQSGHLEVVQYLLSNPDIDVFRRNSQNQTALMLACATPNNGENGLEIIQLLIHRMGRFSDNPDINGINALVYAAGAGDHRFIHMLLPYANSFAYVLTDRVHPLLIATKNRKHLAVRELLKSKEMYPNCIDNDGNTPLMICAMFDFHLVAEELLSSKDTRLDLKNKDGRTALEIAKLNSFTDIVNMIEDRQANITSRSCRP